MLVPLLSGSMRLVTAAQILALSPFAWYRWNTGQTVGQWDDQSGNNRHLIQGTATNQPSLTGGIYTFDGVDNFFQTGALVLAQPFTAAILFSQSSWTTNERIFCDSVAVSPRLAQQPGVSPNLSINCGTALETDPDIAVGAWGVLQASGNGASGFIKTGASASVVGNAGATGFVNAIQLGAGAGANFSNFQCAELIFFPTSLTAPQQVVVYTWMQQQAAQFGQTV